MDGKPWLTILRSMDQSLASVSGSTAADLHDYDLERLWTWKRAGLEARAHPLAASGILAKSFDLGRQRYGSRSFTEWDGNLSGALEGSRLAERLENTPLSPTSLEQWAGCPFRYFLGHVLRISALDDPEEIYAITPLERGSLVHGVLEEFIGKAKEESTLPQPSEPWSRQHRAALESIARSHFKEAETRGVTGKRLIWQLDQDDILSDLYSFLEADTDLRGRFGVSPVYFEARFGRDGDLWPAAELPVDGAAPLKFRGVIDRVDADSSGRDVLVMDYKTGSSRTYAGLKDDPIDKGKHLQLAVYSLAAQRALGADANVTAAYWFTSSRGGFALAPPEPLDLASEDTLGRFKEGVSTIVSGIKNGLFPANPGEPDQGDFTNCRFCDFKSLCPSRKDTLWRRKKGYPLLGGYLQLSEGG
jgi:RecB family exonuclease